MKQIHTFMITGVPYRNLDCSDLDDQVNRWLKENPKVEIEEKILDTSTTITPDSQDSSFHHTLVTITLLIVYRLPEG